MTRRGSSTGSWAASCGRRRHERRSPSARSRGGNHVSPTGGVRPMSSMSSDESLAKAEALLARLEATRAELEKLSQANDADRALDILAELAELSRQVEEELQRAKRRAGGGAEAQPPRASLAGGGGPPWGPP